MGPSSYQQEDADCITAGEVTVQIDCWSTQPAQNEVRALAGAVRKALRPELTLMDNALVLLEHWRTDYLLDPNGTTKHASVRFTGFVEEP
jgi:hypothetical protein